MTDAGEQRFRNLYAAEAPALLGYALRRTPSGDDAADAVAETFTVAWRRIDEVPSGESARPWLFGVARRVIANQRRGNLRRDRLAERLRTYVGLIEVPDVQIGSAEVLAVQSALERLNENDRELLRLLCWEGLTPAEIAIVFDAPPATIRTRLHRARHRLREVLEREANENPTDVERNRPTGHVGVCDPALVADTEILR